MRSVRLVVVWLLAAGVAGAAGPSRGGRDLFTGARPFRNGGAPCGACHGLGGEGLAFTASLGPELSSGLATMDPASLDGLLEALPFPSMTPVYEGRPLTPAERADLVAYLIPAAGKGPAARRLALRGLGRPRRRPPLPRPGSRLAPAQAAVPGPPARPRRTSPGRFPMSWVKDIFDPDERRWEEIYRNRFQHDKVVRSTHGVNCTGGCSWNIHVKNGVVALETQATDYPRISCDVPAYEPRGCQRGISTSWYLYSPLRVKYPYLRGVLMDLWREARKVHADPVAAWASIVDDPEKRRSYQEARGKGGLRRSSWDEVLELVAASTVHTVKRHGSDRIIGFSPIPAMSMLSFAAGSRFLQLLGGVNLSFYDWYCDLPNASPEVWGEQTDVAESADWYHSKFIVSMGANLGMTRTPDVHFAAEARHDGAKLVVLSPRLQHDVQVRRPVDPHPRRPGRRLLAGGGPRHPEGVPPRAADPVLPRLRAPLQRRALPGRARGAGRRAPSRPHAARERARPHQGRRERRLQVPGLGRDGERPAHAPGHAGLPLAAREGAVEPRDEGRRRRAGHRRPDHPPRRERRRRPGGLRRVRLREGGAPRRPGAHGGDAARAGPGGHGLRSPLRPVRRLPRPRPASGRPATTTRTPPTRRPGRSASPGSPRPR